jgi:hypothetical protein
MRNKHVWLIVALAVLAGILSAEEQFSKMGLGVHFGTLTSSGYAMRWMGEKHGFQATIGAYTTGSNNVKFEDPYYHGMYYMEDMDRPDPDSIITVTRKGKELSANLGLSYMYTIDKFKYGRVYIMAGGSYRYYQKKEFSMDYAQADSTEYPYEYPYIYHPIDGTEKEEIVREHRWTVGFGPGFEWALSKQFRLAVEVPITYNWKGDIVMWIPQVGLYYYFK